LAPNTITNAIRISMDGNGRSINDVFVERLRCGV
jgi:hypothetical protein